MKDRKRQWIVEWLVFIVKGISTSGTRCGWSDWICRRIAPDGKRSMRLLRNWAKAHIVAGQHRWSPWRKGRFCAPTITRSSLPKWTPTKSTALQRTYAAVEVSSQGYVRVRMTNCQCQLSSRLLELNNKTMTISQHRPADQHESSWEMDKRGHHAHL